MTRLRSQLFTSSSSAEAFALTDSLPAAFLKAFGRKTTVDLFMSSQWTDAHAIYGVTAYYDDTPAARDEVSWMEAMIP